MKRTRLNDNSQGSKSSHMDNRRNIDKGVRSGHWTIEHSVKRPSRICFAFHGINRAFFNYKLPLDILETFGISLLSISSTANSN
jgi:hypothetical protein